MPSDADLQRLSREAIDHLASFDRPSASDGERRAADWIADRLQARGRARRAGRGGARARDVLVAAGPARARAADSRRSAGAAGCAWSAGAVAAAGIADDVSGGRLWFRRAVLPRHPTWNVVAEAGDADAERTVVVVAHHDAAHWSLLFAPQVPGSFARRFPGLIERVRHDAAGDVPGGRRAAAGGPRAGCWARAGCGGSAALLALGTAATMVEIGSRSIVPGANDNLTGVATVLGLARTLAEQPRRGRARPARLDRLGGVVHGGHAGLRAPATSRRCRVDRTHVICVDTVGSPKLMQLEGEGMLVIRDYPADFKDLVDGRRGRRGRRADPRPPLPQRHGRADRDEGGLPDGHARLGERVQGARRTTTGRRTRPTTSFTRRSSTASASCDAAIRRLARLGPGVAQRAGAGPRRPPPRAWRPRPRTAASSIAASSSPELAGPARSRARRQARRRARAAPAVRRVPRERVVQHRRATSRCRAIASSALRPRVASRSAMPTAASRRPRPGRRRRGSGTPAGGSAAARGRGSRAAGGAGRARRRVPAAARWRAAGRGSRARHRGALAVVIAESRSRPSPMSVRVTGLAMSCSSAPQRSAPPRVSSSASGSASRPRRRVRARRADDRGRLALQRDRRREHLERVPVHVEVVVDGSARRRAAPRAPAARRRSRRGRRAARARPARRRRATTRRSSSKTRSPATSAEPRACARGGRRRVRPRRSKPSSTAQRATRSTRSGSSSKAVGATMRRRRAARSSRPPRGVDRRRPRRAARPSR